MFSNQRGILSCISRMVGLTVLIVDFDQVKHTAGLVYNVIKSLPNLKRLGRLGRVDRQFWRLFEKNERKR
jgi:hypothetical protein